MKIVSEKEFRANQKKYFKLAELEPVYVTRENARPVLISIADDEDAINQQELKSIQKGLEDIRNGRTYRMQVGKDLSDFLNRVVGDSAIDEDTLTTRICKGLEQVKMIEEGKLPKRTIQDLLDEL